jgi:DNA integrity scanning protein DisA with diadenylate cyclase activity
VLAIGRSAAGIRYDGLKDNERIHLIIMLLADETARDYLQVLASLARLVKEPEFVDGLIQAPDLELFYDRLLTGLGGLAARPAQLQQNRVNRIMFREAERVAKGCGCSAIMVFGDTFVGGIEAERWFGSTKTILVTRNPGDPSEERRGFAEIIQVRSFSNQRLAQLRSAEFDTLVVVDVEREFQTLLTGRADLLPADVKPEVLERVLAVAMDLAVEGREGRPVGGLFVVGDTDKVEKLIKPLVLNPFYGYKEEDRNILSPFMDETIKEFSSIDGAFIIRGDGVVESAGSLIQAADHDHALPSGLGSRHAAAAAISVATQCISIVISSSTGQVTLFRRGVMLPLTERKLSVS